MVEVIRADELGMRMIIDPNDDSHPVRPISESRTEADPDAMLSFDRSASVFDP
jgi:hypothetical protein